MITALFVLVVIAAVVGVVAGFFTVEQQTRRIVTSFGRFSRVASPGPNLKIPVIESVSRAISLQIRQLTLSERTYTSQGTSVTIEANVQYSVSEDDESVSKAYYKLSDPTQQIRSHVSSSIRGKVPSMTLEDVQMKQSQIADHVKQELTATMKDFGYLINDVLVTKADPDQSVVDANNQKYASEMAKVTAQNEAAAKAIKITQEAKAEADAMKLRGEGIANERKAIADGLDQSMQELKKAGMTTAQAMNILLYQNQLDAMVKVAEAGNCKVLMLPTGAGAFSDQMDQLNRAVLTANEASKDSESK